ncbi:MAG: hypothetical protein D3923_03425 [Candidatus Electrothrix sp. AR3]|nr:hypothetical protein [Candidatus Electrothrix sp. AR3]
MALVKGMQKNQHTVKYSCPVTDNIEKVTIEQSYMQSNGCAMVPQLIDYSTKLITCTGLKKCKKCILDLEATIENLQ